MNKKILFPLSLLSLVAITSTSCGSSNFKHTVSAKNAVYEADLNHNGKIDDNEKNLTWAETYDVLLDQASSASKLSEVADALHISKTEEKRSALARYEILHEAEELLMSTSAIVPLYNYADPYMMKTNIKGIYSTSLGYKFFDKLTTDDKKGQSYNICVGTKADSFDPSQNTDASTAVLLSQVYEGAMRWEKDEKSPAEEGKEGTYNAKLIEGAATCKKQIVVSHDTYEEIKKDPTKDISDYVDVTTLNDEIKEDERNDFMGTARWTITIKDNAKWDDGANVTADDFIYSWNRSSSGTYNNKAFGMWCNLFDCIRGFDAWNTIGQHAKKDYKDWSEEEQEAWKDLIKGDTEEETKAKEESLNALKKKDWDPVYDKYGAQGGMRGVNKVDDKTFTVQLVNDCEYFAELLAFPAFFPIKKENIILRTDKDGKALDEKNDVCRERGKWWINNGLNPANEDEGVFACNGPLKVNGAIINDDAGYANLTRNTNYKDNDNTTVENISFKFIDKDSAAYSSYTSGALHFIDSMPSSITQQLKTKPDWHVAEQIGLFFYIFNVNDNIFDRQVNVPEPKGERNREKFRRILSLLINRHDLAENVVKSGVTSADGMVSKFVTERYIPEKKGDVYVAKRNNDGTYVSTDWISRNYYPHGDAKGHDALRMADRNDKSGGFYSTYEQVTSVNPPKTDEEKKNAEKASMRQNLDEAYELAKELEAAGTGLKVIGNKDSYTFENFPRITLSTNSGTGLEDLAERMQSYYGLFNIDMSIETQEWQSFSATRRIGDYAYARHGWVADYNDPRTYLDLCRSTDGNNDTQLGKDNFHTSH